MDSKKILVIGSSNTDMTVISEKLPSPGETVLGGRFVMGAGGKGANQAVAAKRLGGDVSFICKVGEDLFGSNSIAQYQREGLNVDKVLRCSTPSGVALINVDKNAENCIVVASGANGEISTKDIDNVKDEIASSSVLLMQLEIPAEAVLRAAQIAHESGVFVVLNPAPACQLPDELYGLIDLIIPNQTELQLMTGCSDEDAHSGISILLERGVKNVIVTQGSKGSLVVESGDCAEIAAQKVKAVDTTAAGDTFCGAVCVALTEGKSLYEAAQFATLASSLTVQRVGAQDAIPTREEVDNVKN